LLVLVLTRSMFHQLDRLRETQEKLAEQREEQGRLEEQLRHIQKIEAVGQLAGGVAHDFNNLLTPIIVSAELARRSLHPGDPLNGRMDGILSAAHKAKELTQKLLSIARKQMLTMTTVDLNRVASDFREILRRTIRGDITIELKTFPGNAAIRGDQGQIEQILLNLAVNAQDAIEGNGRISIEIGRVNVDEALAGANPGMRQGLHVFLAVSDDGCGMTQDVLDHVFEPFFTTKPVGHGTGLGLATVYGIVKQHDGYVRVDSRHGAGTVFSLYFPASGGEEAARPEAPAPEAHAAAPGKCEVLVVEDNEMVRSLVVGMLGTFGYRVRETASPGEALRIASDEGVRIDLLVSDMIMPEMNGQVLYERIREIRPGLPVLFISGYTQDAVVPQVRPGEKVRFLRKPFTMSEFLSNVRAAMGEQ
ncbi:MAG TPA: ATP-binding protein, partial [Candidatus Deferrimicrobiaceae bacterium]